MIGTQTRGKFVQFKIQVQTFKKLRKKLFIGGFLKITRAECFYALCLEYFSFERVMKSVKINWNFFCCFEICENKLEVMHF